MLYANRNAERIIDPSNDMPLLGTPKLTSINAIWPEPDQDFRSNDHPIMNLSRGDILTVSENIVKDAEDICATESCWSGKPIFNEIVGLES